MNSFTETADIETASDDYATRFAGPTGAWMLAEQWRCFREVASACGVTEHSSILDVGGGHAQLATPLQEHGYKVTVTGSDQRCCSRLPTDLQFVVADNLNLPFADRSFDLVVSFRLLPHCNAWQRLVSELCRVARRAVIVDYPTIQSINYLADRFFSTKKKFEKNTRPFTLFSHAEVAEVFSSNGFEVNSEAKEFVLPMALHRMIKNASISQAAELIGAPLKRWVGSPVVVGALRVE